MHIFPIEDEQYCSSFSYGILLPYDKILIMNKKTMNRWIIYGIGMITLALGLTLNTKSNLGVSPIISVAYLFSNITNISFGDVTLLYYCIFVVCEFFLNHEWKNFLQIPFSIVFTRFLNLFSSMFTFQCHVLPSQLFVLLLAIICTGVGAALTVNMDIVPNPGDGIVNAIAQKIGKDMGTTKNIVDFCCVGITLLIGFLTNRLFFGIGIGTILAMIFVGRVIHLFNQMCKKPIALLTDTKE